MGPVRDLGNADVRRLGPRGGHQWRHSWVGLSSCAKHWLFQEVGAWPVQSTRYAQSEQGCVCERAHLWDLFQSGQDQRPQIGVVGTSAWARCHRCMSRGDANHYPRSPMGEALAHMVPLSNRQVPCKSSLCLRGGGQVPQGVGEEHRQGQDQQMGYLLFLLFRALWADEQG